MDRLIESLEGRRLMSTVASAPMSITFAAVNGEKVLTINNAANVQLKELFNSEGNTVHVTGDNGQTDYGFFDNVTQIVINGTDGDDVITLDDTNIKAFVNTFKGIDQITLTGSAETLVTSRDNATVVLNTGPRVDLVSVTGTSVYFAPNGHDYVELDGVPVT
jgi:hypothetical protein